LAKKLNFIGQANKVLYNFRTVDSVTKTKLFNAYCSSFYDIKQVHSCRSEDALAQKRCEIKAEGRGDGSKKMAEKSLKTDRIWSQ
jgi:hypothetical protein